MCTKPTSKVPFYSGALDNYLDIRQRYYYYYSDNSNFIGEAVGRRRRFVAITSSCMHSSLLSSGVCSVLFWRHKLGGGVTGESLQSALRSGLCSLHRQDMFVGLGKSLSKKYSLKVLHMHTIIYQAKLSQE